MICVTQACADGGPPTPPPSTFGQDPLNGSLYVFCNRRRDRIKILFWESSGYWFCIKRLEAGTFRWPRADTASARYNREELTLLLGGIDLAGARRRKWYQRSRPCEK